LEWLGPSLFFAGCPLAFGYVFHAFQTVPDRGFVCVAMALGSFDLIVWGLFLVLMPPITIGLAVVLSVAFVIKKCFEAIE